jgi:hypothetical protein
MALAAPAWQQGFEDQIPGQPPKGWAVTWGDATDTVIAVSNLTAAEGERCLLIDRTVDGSTKPFKFNRNVANPGGQWGLFRFAARIDGAAATSRLTIELGPPHPNPVAKFVYSLRGWGPQIYLYPNVRGATWDENWQAKRVVCDWTRAVWHRVSLAFPIAAQVNEVTAAVEQRDGEVWRPIGERTTVPATPTGDQGAWHLSVISETAGCQLFLDDFQVTAYEARPELPAAE